MSNSDPVMDPSLLSTRSWTSGPAHFLEDMERNASVDCGWGRIIFGQTFADHEDLLAALLEETPGRRDVCLYLRDPHVLVSRGPNELFVDPSLTYRVAMHRYRPRRGAAPAVVVRKMRSEGDAEAINRVYAACGMVEASTEVMWAQQRERTLRHFVAEDPATGEVVGTVTGVDHVQAFADPEKGSSLWCLAVDPQCTIPGVGEALVRTIVERFQALGRAYLDLSVMHDNEPAITLYEKLRFRRVPVFCVKRKNRINERLFTASPSTEWDRLNPYAGIIADEARRRGIGVRILDAEAGYLQLSSGGRRIVTRESLSELTTAVAMSRCDDKRVTRRLLAGADISVPRGVDSGDPEEMALLLDEVGDVVVKPARGEQGAGITVGVTTADDLAKAVDHARTTCPDVLVEERIDGEDLRVLMIDHEVVAAAVRRPAAVTGDGRHTVRELINAQSRRRAAATGGESTIPLDAETERVLAEHGLDLDDVPPEGESVVVRRTANLHTGGTIHDVTDQLHPELAEACRRATKAIDIPVAGLDLLVPAVDGPDHVMIEVNERPGLANHEPRPTAQRFVDLLFPGTRSR